MNYHESPIYLLHADVTPNRTCRSFKIWEVNWMAKSPYFQLRETDRTTLVEGGQLKFSYLRMLH